MNKKKEAESKNLNNVVVSAKKAAGSAGAVLNVVKESESKKK